MTAALFCPSLKADTGTVTGLCGRSSHHLWTVFASLLLKAVAILRLLRQRKLLKIIYILIYIACRKAGKAYLSSSPERKDKP